MNTQQAMAELRKMYGKNAMWRRDEKALKADDLAQLREMLPRLSKDLADAKAALTVRREYLLKDHEYLRLLAEHKDAERVHANAISSVHHFRVVVGVNSGFCFSVRGEGDNWAEAIEAAKKFGNTK